MLFGALEGGLFFLGWEGACWSFIRTQGRSRAPPGDPHIRLRESWVALLQTSLSSVQPTPSQGPGHWVTKGRTPSTPFVVHRGQERDPWTHENFSLMFQDFLGGKSSGPRGGSGPTAGQAGDSVV